MKQRSVSARIDPKFYEALKAEANARGCFVAELVIESLSAREVLSEIASKLGVKPQQCLPRIDEIYTQSQLNADKVTIVTDERDAAIAERDAARQACDTFKAKSEEAEASLAVANEKCNAYEKQSFWERLFKRIP